MLKIIKNKEKPLKKMCPNFRLVVYGECWAQTEIANN